MTASRPRYFVGLDLGQAADFTAIAVAERTTHKSDEQDAFGLKTVAHYSVRHLHRFPLGTAYPTIVDHVATMIAAPELRPEPTLVVDATGVGAPVVDLLEDRIYSADLVPITITGGDQVVEDSGRFRVPKRDLVSAVNILLQTRRLTFAEALAEAHVLRSELQNFRVKITATAHDTYGTWREGKHDDLVLAVALACWYGENPGRAGSGLAYIGGKIVDLFG